MKLESEKQPTLEEHKKRHVELHTALDELAADYISQTRNLLGSTSVMQLLMWSHQQTLNPTLPNGQEHA